MLRGIAASVLAGLSTTEHIESCLCTLNLWANLIFLEIGQDSPSVRDRLLSDVSGAKGGLRSTYEGLGKQYGVTATRIGQIVRDLKKEGVVRVRSSRNGTTITPALGLTAIN